MLEQIPSKMGISLDAKFCHFSKTIIEALKIDLEVVLEPKWPPKTLLQRVIFRSPTSMWHFHKKIAPLPCENHIFGFLRGLKTGHFVVPKSIKNRDFSETCLETWFKRFSAPKSGFWGPKTEAKFEQKSIPRGFA